MATVSSQPHEYGTSLKADIDRVLRETKRGNLTDGPPFVPTQAPNISERIDGEIAAWDHQRTAPDRFCEHGTPAGSHCGRCTALGEMTRSAPTAASFKRGDRVRYIGDNAHKGLEGRVRGIDRWTGEDKVDVELEIGRKGVRKIVAPENLEKIEVTS
jgi:hypothetical protein